MISTPTLFKMGFQNSLFDLGQTALSQTDRDAILVKIDRAFQDAPKVDAFVASKSKTDPNLDRTFGVSGAQRFRDLIAQAGNLVGTAAVIQDRLKSDVASDWVVEAVEAQRVNDYSAAIAQLLAMVNAPAPAGTVAPQTAPASGTILGLPPAVVYVGAALAATGIIVAIARA